MIDKKICSKCNEEKLLNEFYNQKDGYLGKRADCKVCSRKQTIEWHKKHPNANKDYLLKNPEKRKVYSKRYYDKNIEKIHTNSRNYYLLNKEKKLSYSREYYNKHSAKSNAYGKVWRDNNKEKCRKYARDRYKKNLELSTIKWMRNFLYRTEQQGFNKVKSGTINELGYTPKQLIQRIECQFKEGMSWKCRKKWHIDHKKPISAFKKGTSPKIINMLCNLQPMWVKDNLSKNKYFKIH